uniref:Uncharacterized protein n=1 Tax=Rhizophora mucronata TaxID=61149 RepID=A0A2P2N8B3_RHIMU
MHSISLFLFPFKQVILGRENFQFPVLVTRWKFLL